MRRHLSFRARHGWVLPLLIALTCAPELILQAADRGWIGSTVWRLTAYSHGALWAGLLDDWRANYTGQAAAMFLTYGFLHGGLLHLAGNMAGLFCLAPLSLRRLGPRGFALLYVAMLLGGGLGFVLLSVSLRPVVGASGVVYGLAAAWIYWDMRARVLRGQGRGRSWAHLAALFAVNLLSWYLLGGELAWQTHLGGAVAGWLVSWALDPLRRRHGAPGPSRRPGRRPPAAAAPNAPRRAPPAPAPVPAPPSPGPSADRR